MQKLIQMRINIFYHLCRIDFNDGLVMTYLFVFYYGNRCCCFYLGFGKANEYERDEQMRSKYFDPIEHFPDKIDQLLDALNRVSFVCD
jgi:hypothetical protein